MADEINTPEPTPDYSPVEQEALKQGWVPKEEFVGEEHKWVDAGEFIRRGELFEKIDSQNRKLKDMEKSFNAYKSHMERVEEVAYERALKELKQQKVAALEEGDAKTVVQVEDAIEELKQKQAEKVQETVSNEPHPEFQAWTRENSWYNTSGPMRAYADAVGRELAAQGKSPSDVLKEVSKLVREEFPARFRNPNRDKPSAVEAGEKTSSGTSSKTKVVLTEEQTRVMNTLVRGGHITKEKYMADIAAMNERS